MPLSKSAYNSLVLHLRLGKPIQLIFPIYLLAIINLAYYTDMDSKDKKMHWMMWCCIAVIVFLYQYWFLLNRLRSYFLPFLLVYIFNVLSNSKQKDVVLKQIFVVGFFVYCFVFTFGNYKKNRTLTSKINNISTVFERFKYTENEIKQRQMKEALIYWKIDFQNELKNE